MPADRTSRMMLRSASLAVIKTVKRRRLHLFGTDYRPVTCRKAYPLDFTESKPFESSLDRNIAAILSEGVCC